MSNRTTPTYALSSSSKQGAQAIGVVCDVTNEDQVNGSGGACRETFGGVDILVNGAVIFNQKGVLDMPLAECGRARPRSF